MADKKTPILDKIFAEAKQRAPDTPILDSIFGKGSPESDQGPPDLGDPVKNAYLQSLQHPDGSIQPLPSSHGVQGLLKDPLSNLSDRYPDNPYSALYNSYKSSAPLGMGNELQGGRDALYETITGQAPNGFLRQMDQDTAMRQNQLSHQQDKYPWATGAGNIAGNLTSWLVPGLRGLSMAKNALASGVLGAAQTFGNSKLPLDDPQRYKDTAIGGSVAGLLGLIPGGANRAFGLLSPNSDAKAIAALAGGGKTSLAAKKPFEVPMGSTSSPAQEGIQTAQKYGLIDPKGSVLKDLVSGRSGPDVTQLRNNTASVLDSIGQNKVNLIGQAQQGSKTSASLSDIFGTTGSSDKGLKVLGSVAKDLKDNPSTFQEGDALANSLRNIKDPNNIDLPTLNTFLEDIGGLGKFGANVPRSSTAYTANNLYKSGRQFLMNEAEKGLPPEDFDNLQNLYSDYHNLADLQNKVLKPGSINQEWLKGTQQGGPLTQGVRAVLKGGLKGIPEWATQHLAEPALNASLQIAQRTFQPPVNAYIGSIFTSWKEGRVQSAMDKNLAHSYIDNNQMLSPLDKAKTISRLNTTGEFDPNHLPDTVRQSAIDNYKKNLQFPTNLGQDVSNNTLGFPQNLGQGTYNMFSGMGKKIIEGN